jgi:hypothetical protein
MDFESAFLQFKIVCYSQQGIGQYYQIEVRLFLLQKNMSYTFIV